ncbi:integrin alpha-11-like [Ciona intestinalis]
MRLTNLKLEYMFCWCILFTIFVKISNGFNVETNTRTLRFVFSPLVSTANSTTSGLPSGTPPSYFGYDFALRKTGNNLSFTVGAPKSVSPTEPHLQNTGDSTKTTGDLLECPVSNLFSSNPPSRPACNSRNPPGAQRGDAFGLSVDVSPSGKIMACSPTKQQNCGSGNIYSPGYCYNRNRQTNRWTKDPETAKLGCGSTLDLIFVLDGSSSVKVDNFEIIKNWVKNVSEKMNVGGTQIGIVQYSTYLESLSLEKQPYVQVVVPLGVQSNETAFKNSVDRLRLKNGVTATSHALNLTAIEFAKSKRYNNPNNKKVVVLLTDGKSNSGNLPETADYVRSLNITTFAIGVGRYNVPELRQIASGTNNDTRVFKLSDFDALNGITEDLSRAILTHALEGNIIITNTFFGQISLRLVAVVYKRCSMKVCLILNIRHFSYSSCTRINIDIWYLGIDKYMIKHDIVLWGKMGHI